MKISGNNTLLLLLFSTIILLAWNNERESNTDLLKQDWAKTDVDPSYYEWIDEMSGSALMADMGNDYFSGDRTSKTPPAKDVLVQRIPGDDLHLIIMSVYETSSMPFVKVDDGSDNGLILKDDGVKPDKVAGDGIYTAKMFADVKEFRKLAIQMDEDIKKAGPVPQFQNRSLYYAINACNTEPFSAEKLDRYEPVSIANLTARGTNKLIDSIRRNCIFITDLSVVEDPARTWNPCTQTGNVDGPWTFKTIMKNLAQQNPDKPATDSIVSNFVKNWLNNWAVQRIINGDTVNARTLVTTKILNPWLTKSQNAGNPAGVLDMRFAPFKLTAIVNRFDIREREAGIPAGEGRYTFCLINSECTDKEDFTVVIEFGIKSGFACDSIQQWAIRWFNLKNFTLGSPEYNSELQKITDTYTLFGSNPNRVNQSSLNALRTNEKALSPEGGVWEFREFRLSPTTKRLFQTTVHKLPADKYNAQVDNPDVRRMVKYINANRRNINQDDYELPDSLPNSEQDTLTLVPFVAGAGHILDTPVGDPSQMFIYHWNGALTKATPDAFIKNTTTRHVFSLNACTGCHSGEVQTFFTHVDPVFFGTKATLSGFLSGKPGRGGSVDFDFNPDNDSVMIKDAALRPATNPHMRFFSDILRRAKDLKDFVVSPPCGSVLKIKDDLMFRPVNMVH